MRILGFGVLLNWHNLSITKHCFICFQMIHTCHLACALRLLYVRSVTNGATQRYSLTNLILQ